MITDRKSMSWTLRRLADALDASQRQVELSPNPVVWESEIYGKVLELETLNNWLQTMYGTREFIYNKYYETAKSLGLVWTLWDWLEREYPNANEEEIERLHETHEHRAAIQKVIAYEVTYFIYRHLNGPWGEMVDFFLHERNRFTNEYREQTGYQVVGNLPKVFDPL